MEWPPLWRMTWRTSLQSCIDKSKAVVGPKVTLRSYSTPFLSEDHRDSPAGAPGSGPVRECPWCFHHGPPNSFTQYPSVDKLLVRRKAMTETSVGSATGSGKSAKADVKKDVEEGVLASVACSLRMKVLRAARLARLVIYFELRITLRPKCRHGRPHAIP